MRTLLQFIDNKKNQLRKKVLRIEWKESAHGEGKRKEQVGIAVKNKNKQKNVRKRKEQDIKNPITKKGKKVNITEK
jgi:hypothetical protein